MNITNLQLKKLEVFMQYKRIAVGCLTFSDDDDDGDDGDDDDDKQRKWLDYAISN